MSIQVLFSFNLEPPKLSASYSSKPSGFGRYPYTQCCERGEWRFTGNNETQNSVCDCKASNSKGWTRSYESNDENFEEHNRDTYDDFADSQVHAADSDIHLGVPIDCQHEEDRYMDDRNDVYCYGYQKEVHYND